MTSKTDTVLLTFKVEEGTTRNAVLGAGKGKKRAFSVGGVDLQLISDH